MILVPIIGAYHSNIKLPLRLSTTSIADNKMTVPCSLFYFQFLVE